jgi:hypothetical protein
MSARRRRVRKVLKYCAQAPRGAAPESRQSLSRVHCQLSPRPAGALVQRRMQAGELVPNGSEHWPRAARGPLPGPGRTMSPMGHLSCPVHWLPCSVLGSSDANVNMKVPLNHCVQKHWHHHSIAQSWRIIAVFNCTGRDDRRLWRPAATVAGGGGGRDDRQRRRMKAA